MGIGARSQPLIILKENFMKAKVVVEQEVNVKYMQVTVPVRYEDEDIPYDFPLRNGDVWSAKIDMDTQTIIDWPQGKTGDMHLKVCDEGVYELFDESMKPIAKIDQDYVPSILPGEHYGDYLILEIDESGKIADMDPEGSLDEFFPRSDW